MMIEVLERERERERQTDRQTDRQTEREREKERERERAWHRPSAGKRGQIKTGTARWFFFLKL